MTSAVTPAYNGGLGAEPPAAVQGAEPPVGDKGAFTGAKPPEADEVFVFKAVIFDGSAAVLHEMMYYYRQHCAQRKPAGI